MRTLGNEATRWHPCRLTPAAPLARPGRCACLRHGGTILETLIALAVFIAGIAAIIHYYPLSIRASHEAADLSQAMLIAQAKAEEIRRDNDQGGALIAAISAQTEPTSAVVCAQDARFAYRFSGLSTVDANDAPTTPRVVIEYSDSFRPRKGAVAELKFLQ